MTDTSDRVLVVGVAKHAVESAVGRVRQIGVREVEGVVVDLLAPTRTGRLALFAQRLHKAVRARRVSRRAMKELSYQKVASRADGIALAVSLDEYSSAPLFRLARERPGITCVENVDVAIRLLTGAATVTPPPRSPWGGPHAAASWTPPRSSVRLLVGPHNRDGDASGWAGAGLLVPGTAALSTARFDVHDPMSAPVDLPLVGSAGGEVQATWSAATHVLWEGPPILLMAQELERSPAKDLWELSATRHRAVVLGVDDLLDPADHARRHSWSQFRDLDPAALSDLSAAVAGLHDSLRSFDGTVFVTESWLLGVIPGAALLPQVVPSGAFGQRVAPGGRGAHSTPIVASWSIGGHDEVRTRLETIAGSGQIEHYHLERVPPTLRASVVGAADVVVDRLGLGGLGWAGRLGLAAGRVVMARRVGVDRQAPVVELGPEAVEAVICDVAGASGAALDLAAQGPSYATRRWSDGAVSAILAGWLGRVDLHG